MHVLVMLKVIVVLTVVVQLIAVAYIYNIRTRCCGVAPDLFSPPVCCCSQGPVLLLTRALLLLAVGAPCRRAVAEG